MVIRDLFEKATRRRKRVSQPKPQPKLQDDWLDHALDEALIFNQREWDEPRKFFRASGTGERCERALTFDVMGHRVPVEPRVARIFKAGYAIEKSNIDTMELVPGLLGDTQKKVELTDPPIVGHYDVRIRTPRNRWVIGDIKSIKTENFDKLPEQHGLLFMMDSPLLDYYHYKYLCQLNTYLFGAKLTQGFLLFEDKNDQRRKIFWLKRDEELHAIVLDIHKTAWEYASQNPIRLAPIPEGFNPSLSSNNLGCKWCNHRYLCRQLPETAGYEEVRALDAKLRST